MYKNAGPLLVSKIRGSVRLIPEEFLAKSGLDIRTQKNPLDIEPSLPNGVEFLIESRVEQDQTNERKKVDTYLFETIDKELISTVMLPSGYIGTRTRNLVDEGDVLPPATSLTIEADQRNLGNGLLDQTIVTSPFLFDDKASGIEVENPIPPQFRALVPTYQDRITLPGTITSPQILGTGELSRLEDQLDITKYRRTTTSLPHTSLPISFDAFKTTEDFGGGIVKTTASLDDSPFLMEQGFLITSAYLQDLRGGLFLKVVERNIQDHWDVIPSRLWDENWQTEYDETTQVVTKGTAEDTPPGGVYGWVSEVKGLDTWRSRKTNTSKSAPPYTSAATAQITYDYRPFRFPGYLYFATNNWYVRGAHADLVKQKIRTWWVKSANPPPEPVVSEIIMDNPIIGALNDITQLSYASEVLHDEMTTFGVFYYPATTPSASEYAFGTITGTTVSNSVTVYAQGSGYTVGDGLSFTGASGTIGIHVDALSTGGGVFGFHVTGGTFTGVGGGPYAATGGSGSGAAFFVTSIEVPTYDTSTKWIGTEKVVAASVTKEREKDIWKYQTRSVIMR